MKTAIITGASSGIGLEISKVFVKHGIKVIGIGRDFSKINFNDELFITMSLDMMKTNLLIDYVNQIKKTDDIFYLVNNAGVGYFGPHEELNRKKIHEMVTINLEIPLILSQILLRDIKKNSGFIINISSVTAKKSNTYGCAYGATKAALTSFSNSLFDETRKYGVKVISIHPDITKTNFYRNASFSSADDEECYIFPTEIADIVESIILQRNSMIITDITIQPQKHRILRK